MIKIKRKRIRKIGEVEIKIEEERILGDEKRNKIRIEKRIRRGEDLEVGRRKDRGKRKSVGIKSLRNLEKRILKVEKNGEKLRLKRI